MTQSPWLSAVGADFSEQGMTRLRHKFMLTVSFGPNMRKPGSATAGAFQSGCPLLL